MEPSAPRHGNTPESSGLCDDCKALQFDDSVLGGFIGESATGAPMLKIREEPRTGHRTGARKPLWVQNRSDFAPDFPGLRRASQAGCGFCGYLRGSLMKGQPLSDLEQRRRIDMVLCYAWAPRRPDNLVNVHDGESEGLQALAVYFDDSLAPKSGVLYFGIYSEDRLAADWLGLYEPPRAKPLCVENISSMKTALEHCSSTCHPRESATYIPTRLLDLGRDLGEEPRLIIMADLAVNPQGVIEPLDYATLSYCWGDKDDGAAQTKTDPSSLQQRLRGIQPSEMSRVLQDAITVCRAFSVRYLWVDALCIIQDEEDTSDWEKESDRVGEVYQHAYFTICAASTTSCHQSFLDRQESFDFPFQSSLQPEARGTLKLVYTGHHHLELSSDHNPLAADRRSSLWYTRGWVYQERYLSSRRLIFGRHMLHFECGEIEFSENGECVRPNIVDWSARATNDTSQRRVYSHFRSQVGVYASHSLTYESDRLSALSGIAKKVFDRTGDTYLAGIWKQDLHVGLLWNSCNIGGNLAELLNSFKDHTNRAAPSWSWASLPGYLTYGISGINVNHQQRHLRPEYRAIDGWTELQGAQLNRFGAVKNGTIRVVGRLMALSSDYDLTQQNFFDKDIWKVYRGGDLAAYCALDYIGSHPTEEAGSAVILLLSSACRLVGKIPDCYQEYAEAEGSGTSHGDGDGEGNGESESEIEHTGEDQGGSGCGDETQKLHQDGEEEVEGVGGSEEDDDGDQASVDIDSCALCNNTEHNREVSGLILHPANQPGQFYRVGVFLSRPFGAGGTHLFKDVEERRIDII